mgnify:CR=1 FL=1
MKLKLYHGSANIIEKPEFGLGNAKNDYGLGFYCTEHIELAKEWACAENRDGFANEYELEMDGLTILNLSEAEYHILNWLAILLENRTFVIERGLPSAAKEYILSEFLPDYEEADVIRGYRADDSYFSFASAFLNNTISLEQLGEAMKLGKLGEQVVIKSRNLSIPVLSLQTIRPITRKQLHVTGLHVTRSEAKERKQCWTAYMLLIL